MIFTKGAGGGEVHHTQRVVLGDQQGVRSDAQGGRHSLHHPHGELGFSHLVSDLSNKVAVSTCLGGEIHVGDEMSFCVIIPDFVLPISSIVSKYL